MSEPRQPECANRDFRCPRSSFIGIFLLGTLLAAAPLLSGGFPPDQPFASFWFPNDLLTWNPATDPDAPFNRSAVPLADRFTYAGTEVNGHARPDEATVTAISIMNPSTSNNPSQGSLVFDRFAFNYWQYVDLLIFWGGSASEGIILAPNPGVVDAGHRHGVEVLGTIFFPPNVFGGQLQWVRDLVQRSGNTFPVADKLIEVAETYGFDGWFINQETNGGNAALATDIRDFIRYVKANSDLHIQWYDSMVESGPIAWQNQLNSLNDAFVQENGGVTSDSMFLNFNWNAARLTNSRTNAQNLGRSPYDIYAGIDVQANGYFTPVDWPALFPEGEPHRVSLGYFGTNWTYTNSANRDDFYQRANRFWVGANRDPANTTAAGAWKGMAHYVPARSSAGSLPFVTHFDTGQGDLVAIDGEVRRNGPWNHRALQDLLPTWRWRATADAGTPLVPGLVWDDPYYGGTSLRVAGDLGGSNRLDLYKTQLPLTASSKAQVAFTTGATGDSHLQLLLVFEDGSGGTTAATRIDVGPAAQSGWNLVELDLSPHAGKTVAILGLGFEAPTAVPGYEVNVGRIALFDGSPSVPAPADGANVVVKDEWAPGTASVRLTWTGSPDPVRRYNVYRVDAGGGLTFLGGTPGTAYFIAEVLRDGVERSTTLAIEAVGPEMGHGDLELTRIFWEDTGIVYADDFEFGDLDGWSRVIVD
ncbi:MAG: glycoside hydrolase [Acidobacteriota bacterium]